MREFIQISTTFGVVFTLVAYRIGLFLQKKTKKGICNPLFVSILLVIFVLKIFRLAYTDYQSSGLAFRVNSKIILQIRKMKFMKKK